MIVLSEETRKFIREHQSDGVKELALRYHSKLNENPELKEALIQIKGRQSAKEKLPLWYDTENILYPPKLSLEQSSSQITAKYKTTLFSGNTFVDLTGGFGVDFTFLSENFKQAIYVEKQKSLGEIAAYNFDCFGLKNVQVVCEDGMDYLQKMPPADLIFIDPARRSESGCKVVSIENCEPDVSKIQDLLQEKASHILIKLSPMLDISQALKTMKNCKEIHIVSVDNECKELLLLVERNYTGEPRFVCLNFNRNKRNDPVVSFLLSEEKQLNISCTSVLESYLYEPNSSILKSGYFKGLTTRFSIRKLHPASHLYTSDEFIDDFPGRIFSIEDYSSLNKKELKRFLENRNSANLTVRNFPLSVESLRRKLKIKEGKSDYLFATTLNNGDHVLIRCRKPST